MRVPNAEHAFIDTSKLRDYLFRGEIGAVVECYANDGYEVEFVSLDGYTYALVALRGNQLIPLRQKLQCMAKTTVLATIFTDQPVVEAMTAGKQ